MILCQKAPTAGNKSFKQHAEDKYIYRLKRAQFFKRPHNKLFSARALSLLSFGNTVGHHYIKAEALMPQQPAEAVNGTGFHFEVGYTVVAVPEFGKGIYQVWLPEAKP